MKADKTRELLKILIYATDNLPPQEVVKESTEELKELERLAEIGKATEQAMYNGFYFRNPYTEQEFRETEDILNWDSFTR